MAERCDPAHVSATLAERPWRAPLAPPRVACPRGVRVPIHPVVASKFHLLEGIESFETALADPELRPRLDAFMSMTDAPAPPAVDVRPAEAPGPHGPVPVRVYS